MEGPGLIKKELVEKFKEQLTIGAPTNEDESGLRRLAAQIRAVLTTG